MKVLYVFERNILSTDNVTRYVPAVGVGNRHKVGENVYYVESTMSEHDNDGNLTVTVYLDKVSNEPGGI